MDFPYDADLWDFYNQAEREFHDAGKEPKEPGWWHASALGKCPNSLIRLQLDPTSETNPISAKSRRAYAVGTAIHDMKKTVAGRLGLLVYPPDGNEFYLRDEELRLSGYIDRLMVWPPLSVSEIPPEIAGEWTPEWIGFLTDLRAKALATFDGEPGYYALEDKSIKASSMTHAPLWVDGAPGEPKPEHLLQVGAYALMARRNPDQLPGPLAGAKVTYTGKDSGGVLEFDIDLDEAADAAMDRIAVLSAEFAKDDVADITCECEGFQVLYCPHRYLLEETAGPKGGRRIRAACCQGATTERAWRNGDEELFK